MSVTYQQILDSKKYSEQVLLRDWTTLKAESASENKRKFCGNKFLYHFQIDNLCRTKTANGTSLFDIMSDETLYAKLHKNMQSLKRTGSEAEKMLEAWRINGAVVFFKPFTAKYLYSFFKATHVLDPTAGWGGRMLGAIALGISYTGIDTNEALKKPYEDMLALLHKENPKVKMYWESCLTVDFSKIDYDYVLTSPPYINLEIYQGMTPFESKTYFYKEFLIPLINKCRQNIKRNGTTSFNISPAMYADLLANGYEEAHQQIDLLQQTRFGKHRSDKIYCWRPL